MNELIGEFIQVKVGCIEFRTAVPVTVKQHLAFTGNGTQHSVVGARFHFHTALKLYGRNVELFGKLCFQAPWVL